MRRRVPVSRMIALLGVLALHLLLFWLLRNAMLAPAVRDAHAAPPARVTLRLLALPPPLPQPMPRTAIVRHAARAITRGPSAAPARNIATSPATITPPDTSTAATVPDAPASGIEQLPSLLETAASRRALRESAHAATDYSRYGGQTEREGPNQRLAAGIQSAGKGDCLKGDYPGSGMGLLSLPFLAIAEASGNCAK